MPAFPTLETTRLTMRELSADDAPVLFSIFGNAQAMRHFGMDPLRKLDDARQLIEKFAAWRSAPNPGVRWGLVARETGQLIGTCGLFAWNRDWCKCATGYELHEDFRGQGFMREALCAAFSWGFADMQLNRIEAQIHLENKPSLKLAERLGFRQEGLLRKVARWGGEFHDLLQFGLLRSDWRDDAARLNVEAP